MKILKSSIVFYGTVSQLAATSFADVPKSAQTIVVHVETILKKPAAVSLKKGDSVTVEVKDASGFQEGTQATFFTDGWIFGSGVAVKELGHVLGLAGEPAQAEGGGIKPQSQAPEQMSDAQAEEMVPARVRDMLLKAGALPEGATAQDLRQFLARVNADFRDKAPVSAAQAATIILDGVRAGAWRILIGEDAKMIDAAVRAKPEASYDYAELFAGLTGSGGDQAS